nr:cytochrome P450 6k1-like [Onthophagus taurus]
METLRKYPVLPFLDRMCNTDYKLPGTDIIIEKGTPVYIPMFGLHYDEKYWNNPQKYDPERFSDEEINKRHQYAYIPFGSGPHNCIGERFGLNFHTHIPRNRF